MDTTKLHIHRYWNDETGDYVCDDGISWDDDPLDFVLIVQLNQCGCGMPEETAKYILKTLETINGRFDDEDTTDMKGHFHSEGENYFVLHILEHLELLEHGTSAPGWLTIKGKEVMEDLQVILYE